jgi:HAD superfamily hydrolase (TIGR01549 family)
MTDFPSNPKGKSPSSDSNSGQELLLFDFDGTIADTRSIAHRILNDMSKEFGFKELPEDQLEAARDMSTRKFIAHLGISRWRVPMIAKRGLQLLHERIDQVQPIAGMPETIASLHGRGHRIGILTSNSEANVDAFLKRHELPYFHFVRTSSKLFGKAREMRRILKTEKTSPSGVLYVGDETRDIDAAKETGLRIAAVTWGYNSAEALSAMKPDHMISSPEELLQIAGNKR